MSIEKLRMTFLSKKTLARLSLSLGACVALFAFSSESRVTTEADVFLQSDFDEQSDNPLTLSELQKLELLSLENDSSTFETSNTDDQASLKYPEWILNPLVYPLLDPLLQKSSELIIAPSLLTEADILAQSTDDQGSDEQTPNEDDVNWVDHIVDASSQENTDGISEDDVNWVDHIVDASSEENTDGVSEDDVNWVDQIADVSASSSETLENVHKNNVHEITQNFTPIPLLDGVEAHVSFVEPEEKIEKVGSLEKPKASAGLPHKHPEAHLSSTEPLANEIADVDSKSIEPLLQNNSLVNVNDRSSTDVPLLDGVATQTSFTEPEEKIEKVGSLNKPKAAVGLPRKNAEVHVSAATSNAKEIAEAYSQPVNPFLQSTSFVDGMWHEGPELNPEVYTERPVAGLHQSVKLEAKVPSPLIKQNAHVAEVAPQTKSEALSKNTIYSPLSGSKARFKDNKKTEPRMKFVGAANPDKLKKKASFQTPLPGSVVKAYQPALAGLKEGEKSNRYETAPIETGTVRTKLKTVSDNVTLDIPIVASNISLVALDAPLPSDSVGSAKTPADSSANEKLPLDLDSFGREVEKKAEELFAPDASVPEALTSPESTSDFPSEPKILITPTTGARPEMSPTPAVNAEPARIEIPSVQATPASRLAPLVTPTPAPLVVPPAPTPPAPATTPASVQPAAAQPPAGEKQDETFLIQFNNIGIIEYLNFISKITSKNFIFDDADMDFRVTIVSNEPTSIENIMAALLQELRIHGLALMEVGNNLIIHRNYRANSPARIVGEGDSSPQDSDLLTQVFRLTNSPPEKMAEILKPMLSDLALVEAVPETNHLIITDIKPNIDRIRTLINNLDAPSTSLEVGQYVVNNATVDSAINLVDRILAPLAQGKPLVFVPHSATNSIYIVSTPYLVEKSIAILQQIDVNEGSTRILSVDNLPMNKRGNLGPNGQPEGGPFGPNDFNGGLQTQRGTKKAGKWAADLPLGFVESTKFFIKKLEYQKGDKLVESLKRIADSLIATGVQNTSLITTINSIQWLESTNSLVYTGTEESIIKVTQLIEEVDIPLQQVLIEVLILETTIDDSINFGVDWGARFSGDDAAGSEAFLSGNSPLVAALDSAVPNNPLNAGVLARTQGFHLGVIGRNIRCGGVSFNSIGALVSALHGDTTTNIVMNPKIVVEDNTPAEIFVGINTAFQTQAIANELGNLVTSNFEFRDIGATLKVTPLIGSNDLITLDIVQEVSSLVNPLDVLTTGTTSGVGTVVPSLSTTTTTTPGPTTRKSKTTTKIHIPDGYFVILSGMIQDEDRKTRAQVPCLGGVPILGGAFQQRDHRDARRNLLIFIRPKIVHNDIIDEITKREQDIFREKCRFPKFWEYEVDEALDFFNLKHICSPDEQFY